MDLSYHESLLQHLARLVLEQRQSMDVSPEIVQAFHDDYAIGMQEPIEQLREAQRMDFESSRQVCLR